MVFLENFDVDDTLLYQVYCLKGFVTLVPPNFFDKNKVGDTLLLLFALQLCTDYLVLSFFLILTVIIIFDKLVYFFSDLLVLILPID
jgi:hypothetical protein